MPTASPSTASPRTPSPRPTAHPRPALRLLPSPPLGLSATRIGANGATLALHLLVLGLLLAPPAPFEAAPAPPPLDVQEITPVLPPRPVEPPPRITTTPTPTPPRQATRQPPLQERGEQVAEVPATDVPDDAPIADAPPAPTTGFDAPAAAGPSAGLRALHAPAPRYPRSALIRRAEGTVLLRVRVGPDGLPRAVTIERGSGHRDLDRAARAAVEGWRFAPTLRDGVAVASEGLLPVDFSLDP